MRILSALSVEIQINDAPGGYTHSSQKDAKDGAPGSINWRKQAIYAESVLFLLGTRRFAI